MPLTIYHNPRCSKSRQTLALIEEAGAAPHIIRYLDTPPSEAELRGLFSRLGLGSARAMMRTGEDIYKEKQVAMIDDEDELFKLMAAFPKLIERPIVDNGKKAILGRPPENVKVLLNET